MPRLTKKRSLLVRGLLVLTLGVLLVLAVSSAIRSRLAVVGLKMTGRLPDVPYKDLPYLLAPGSGFNVGGLLSTYSGAATFDLPASMLTDTAAGSRIFGERCSSCHGVAGEGKLGPSLISGIPRRGATDWGVFRVIRDGVPGTAMRPTGLSFKDAWHVVGVLRARRSAHPDSAGAARLARARPVSDPDLIANDTIEDEWLSWSGGLSGRRYRRAPDLDAASIARLRLTWAYPMPADPAASQSSPIAVGNLLIMTTAEDVIALDQRTGEVAWTHHHPLAAQLSVCCTRGNRGVAVYGTSVFVGTLDARVLALDLATGRQVWETKVAESGSGVSITGAPLIAEGRLIVGVSGGEFPMRGFLDAYDPATGKRLWRFYTIPAAGEPGSETWPAEVLNRGGAGTWVTGAFDPERHLLYWGTGNPTPGMAPDIRPGDNRYSCSVLALDVRTGKLVWTYQFTPNDSHDWDATQTPILIDAPWKGVQRPLILWVNRNGFFYVLDRETGEFLRGTPFVKQTWNKGFDGKGRPIVAARTQPTQAGAVVFPGASVAANWWPASYSPDLNLVFVSAWEIGGIYVRGPTLQNFTGYTGGTWHSLGGPQVFLAIEVETGKLRWRTPGSRVTGRGTVSGTLALGSNLVLTGAGNQLLALDARTGHEVWKLNLGAPIQAAPVLFRVDGQPRLAVTAGSVLYVLGLDNGKAPTVTAASK